VVEREVATSVMIVLRVFLQMFLQAMLTSMGAASSVLLQGGDREESFRDLHVEVEILIG
jgi:hypothetical protein